ncbi:serine hydrolase domain-containing protein [Flagellimonas nanhaiensis]|nr:serine hydrolase domain-containing protein [Allomuricauda nanhaiensis]
MIKSISHAMQEFHLTGLSVAVFDNYEIVWRHVWGHKVANTDSKIDFETAFSTASIAKPVTATLLAMLEEEGLINLDAPVSKYLKRWNLPKNDFGAEKILTLKHLLSNTGGTSQHGFTDYYLGDTIPTLVESLEGEIANNSALELTFYPGTHWRYSGGGYVIAQVAIEDHLGFPLAHLAQEYIFGPLGMKRTTMKQPNEDGFLSNVAKAHDQNANIINTGIPITPQVAPSGLWSNPTDMSIFLIELQNALRNKNNRVISHSVAKKVTDIVTSKVMGGWSMGWERRYGFCNQEWFSHGGANTGTGGHVYATMEGGKGIVLFGNGPNQNRIPVLDLLRDSIFKSLDWYRDLNVVTEPIPKDLKDKLLGSYQHIVFGENMTVFERGGKIFMQPSIGVDESELLYLGDNFLEVDQYPSKLRIDVESDPNFITIYQIRNITNEENPLYRKDKI